MARRKKYPDTSTFRYHNANPKNRITTDCVIRAISTATGVAYNKVVLDLAHLQIETGYDNGDKKLYDKYLQRLGFTKCRQPRKPDGKKYTGSEFCETLTGYERIVANIGRGHVVAIVDGKVHDTWNSTSFIIGNYWLMGR